jgi:hypothetical protein
VHHVCIVLHFRDIHCPFSSQLDSSQSSGQLFFPSSFIISNGSIYLGDNPSDANRCFYGFSTPMKGVYHTFTSITRIISTTSFDGHPKCRFKCRSRPPTSSAQFPGLQKWAAFRTIYFKHPKYLEIMRTFHSKLKRRQKVQQTSKLVLRG